MKRIAYLRISTLDQSPDRQIDGLKDMADELHIETLSAISPNRPVYDKVINSLEPGDELIVWAIDRAYRSVTDALSEAEKLRARGINFQIANLQIDTSTPGGIFVYTIMSALAEFERRTLSQRTKEGLEAARRRGKRIGRPPKLSCEQIRKARVRISRGNEYITKVAADLGVAPWTLTRAIRRIEETV